jgi:hypothetical protein
MGIVFLFYRHGSLDKVNVLAYCMQNKGVRVIAHEAVDAYITFKTGKTAINLN